MPSAVAASPSPICPPEAKAMTVTNHNVAAVVTPRTRLSRLRMAPPPMNPCPSKCRAASASVEHHEGIRGSSLHRQQQVGLNHGDRRRQHTNSVVRSPDGRPCSPRSRPTSPPATTERANLSAISCHVNVKGIDSLHQFKPDLPFWVPAADQYIPAYL